MAFTASQAFDLLRTAFSRNRLPHALLIVGDEHQGASRRAGSEGAAAVALLDIQEG